MTVQPLGIGDTPAGAVSDVAPASAALLETPPPLQTPPPLETPSFTDALSKAFGDASAGLTRAADAERAFANGRGGLQEMVLERAQADITLSIASAAAARTTQALTTILGMQI